MTKLKGNKLLLMILALIALLSVSAFAGTTDSLGLSSVWDKLSAWITDPVLTKIIAVFLLGFTIMLLVKQQYVFAVMILVAIVMITKLDTIASTFASATF